MKKRVWQVKYNLWRVLPLSLLLFSLAAGIAGFRPDPWGCRAGGGGSRAERSTGRVQSVIDGDTIILQDGRKIRYLNIDCPEKGEPFFDRALRFNRGLVGGKRVHLTFCPEKQKDRYGRWLAHVRCGGTHAGRALLREGLAFLLLITPCGLDVEIDMASDFLEARIEKRGIWGREELFYVSPRAARTRIGRHAIVEGPVTGSFSNDKLTFFDIGERSGNNLRLVIFSTYFSAFGEKGEDIPKTYEKTTVKAWGKLEDYKGRPEIFLFSPYQITIENES